MDWSARSPRWRSSCCSGRSLARFSKALDACCARSRPEIGDPAYCHARIRHTPLMDASIAVSREGSIATVVLNRPDKLNALTKAMWRSLGETIDRLSADDSLRCVIVRGAGEKAFSPGNDIAEFESERANKAKDKRPVTRVVADADVAREARATAERIAEGAPLVARWHKKFARRLADPHPLCAAERDECFDCFDTEDFRIGYRAFLAREKPRFVGK